MNEKIYIDNMHCDSCKKAVADVLEELQIEVVELEVGKAELKNGLNNEKQVLLAKKLEEVGYHLTKQKHNHKKQSDGFWTDRPKWKRASFNTLNCLIGCSIGDFGTIIFIQSYYPKTNVFLMMGMAMIMGLITSITLETIILKIREGFNWNKALSVAFGMSFLSMLAMELTENTTDYLLTKGEVPLSDPFYWIALSIALIAGFLVPLPYNYYKLKKYDKACH